MTTLSPSHVVPVASNATQPDLFPRQQPPQCRTVVARHAHQIIAAWRLVYKQYLAAGLIDPQPDRFHTFPKVVRPGTTVVARLHGRRIVSTISSYPGASGGLPLDGVYPEELRRLREAGHRLGEIGLFADRCGEFARGATARFDFMRYPIYALYHQQVSKVMIGVHPRHAAFYCRLLGFEQAGPQRRYRLVRDRPVILLSFDMRKLDRDEAAPRGLRYWREHRLEAKRYSRRFDFAPHRVADTLLAGDHDPYDEHSHHRTVMDDGPSAPLVTTVPATNGGKADDFGQNDSPADRFVRYRPYTGGR